MGRLVRAEGGLHPQRRWRRHLSQGCPQLNAALEHTSQASSQDHQEWTQEFLESLARKHLLPREQVTQVIDGTVIEILPDIIQHEEVTRLGKFRAKTGIWGALCAPQIPVFAL